MNWPFRSLRTLPSVSPSFASPPSCDSIEPLLPLYVDGMASPDEMRFVEAHLPGCVHCRESLFWMQATHRALASRPVAVPPANLHSRIAEAIAVSSAAPGSMRPVRSFTLRPAYAAAASLTALGFILSYSLLYPPVPNVSAVKPAPKTILASGPPATPRVKNVLPRAARVKPHPLVARNFPAASAVHGPAKFVASHHVPMPEKTVPANAAASPDRVADNTLVPAHAFVPLHVQVKLPSHLPAVVPGKMASGKVPFTDMHHPAALETPVIKPNIEIAMLPRHDKEPSVQVHIDPPIVTDPPPTLRIASSRTEASNLLAVVNAHVRTMPTFLYGKTSLMEHQISRGGTNAMHALDTEHSAYQPAVYTP